MRKEETTAQKKPKPSLGFFLNTYILELAKYIIFKELNKVLK
ncbi:hypothetical protein [Acinetobacter radioresistens]